MTVLQYFEKNESTLQGAIATATGHRYSPRGGACNTQHILGFSGNAVKSQGFLAFVARKVFSGCRFPPDQFRISFTATLSIQASVNQLVPDGKPGKFTIIAKIALVQQPLPACILCLCAYAVGFGVFVVDVSQGQPSENLQHPL